MRVAVVGAGNSAGQAAAHLAKFADEVLLLVRGDALAAELQDHCKSRLQRYQYPHMIEFVSELPKTVTGKIQRYKLREKEATRARA